MAVNPCDDFFEFACGSWIKNNPIPPGETVYQVFTTLEDKTTADVLGIFENLNVEGEPKAVRKAKTIYDSCKNANNAQIHMNKPLLDLINSYGGWPMINSAWSPPDPKDLVAELGKLGRDKGVNPLISTLADVDVKNVSQHILYVDQPQLTLGLIDYYTNVTYQSKADAYKQLIVKVAKILAKSSGEEPSDSKLTADAERIFQLEKRIAQISVPDDQRRNQNTMYFPYTIDQLNSKYAYFRWLDFFTPLINDIKKVDGGTTVIIASPPYFEGLKQIVDEYTSDQTSQNWKDMNNYLIWRLINPLLPFLDEEIRSSLHILRDVRGPVKAQSLREEECVNFLINNLPWPTGRLYVQNFFPEDSRPVVSETIKSILTNFKGLLSDLEWIDQTSNANAQYKADHVAINPAYPEFILNDIQLDAVHSDLIVDDGTFFTVLENVTSWEVNQMYKKLNLVPDRYDFLMSPAVVNAWYQPQYNSITFPAAILQPPFFKNKFPWAVNYGGIGVVMGHELTHGFDDQGVNYDWDGTLHTWMDSSSQEGFNHMAKCVVDEYSSFCYPNVAGQGELCINGVNTQGENIADNGGIREAFNAYQQYVARFGNETLVPGMEALSMNQIFFLSFASAWCSNYSDPALSKQLLTNPHSPGRDRVLGTVRNYEEFGKAFQCRIGVDKMFPNPQDKCDVWSKHSTPVYPANITFPFFIIDYGKPWSDSLSDANSKLYQSVVSQHIASVSDTKVKMVIMKFMQIPSFQVRQLLNDITNPAVTLDISVLSVKKK